MSYLRFLEDDLMKMFFLKVVKNGLNYMLYKSHGLNRDRLRDIHV